MGRNRLYLLSALVAGVLIAIGLYWGIVVSRREPSTYELELGEYRLSKDQFLRNSPQTPIPEHIRLAFQGLKYYPANPKWKLKAAFARRVQVNDRPTITEDSDLKLAGVLYFQVDSKQDSLLAYWQQPDRFDELFVPFRDATNGKGTYAGGRYLNLRYVEGDSIEIDFNKAYNPLCAYNPMKVCPLPPPANVLRYKIEAGEMEFPLKDRL
jgi:uncharacterized protein (DUF1684 family)